MRQAIVYAHDFST